MTGVSHLSTPLISVEALRATVAAWQSALDAGHPAFPPAGGHKSASTVAGERLGLGRAAMKNRLDIAAALGLAPSWPTPLDALTTVQKYRLAGFTLEKPRHRVPAGSAPVEEPVRGNVPMSEDQKKFHPDWTAQDCIIELRRIAEIDTTKVISRNYFRNNSDISESTWNRYFGTFEEYKRQAGIILSRHVHRLEKDIAKHASVDGLRTLNAEKREWEGAYERPSSRRFQTALVASDLHDLHCDLFYRRCLLATAARVQPEKIVLNGDIFDLPEFSKHFQDPRAFVLLDRIRWVHAFLRELRDAAPNAEIVLVEGNHEFRLLRHMSEQTPAMLTVLADLHGFNVAKLLGLTAFEINFVARADMTAWTERDIKSQLRKNYVRLWDAQLYGHFPEMRQMGIPGASGHHHKHIVWTDYSPVYGPWEWHQIGCGHQREASYCNGERWANGFLLAHVDIQSKRTQFEYIDTSHQAAFIGGKHYERTELEPILDLVA